MQEKLADKQVHLKNNQFKDKVVIVTGGGSGIGKALCVNLAKLGAIIIVTDIDINKATEVKSTIESINGYAESKKMDVTDYNNVKQIITSIAEKYSRIDYIFNNAGISILGEIRDFGIDHWNKVINVNLFGVLYGTIVSYPIMVKQGLGHIVNVASLGGLFPSPFNAPYIASKHAVVGLTKTLRIEAKELNVKVSVVCPGAVRTGIFENTEIVNIDRNQFFESFPTPTKGLLEVNKAVEIILKGVIKNRGMILFPIQFKIGYWLYKNFPFIVNGMFTKFITKFRNLRN